MELRVGIDSDKCVNYTLLKTSSGEAVASGGGFSTYQRWFFFWDERNRLWCQNSDLGQLYVYAENESGEVLPRNVFAEESLSGEVPRPVYEYLPDPDQRALAGDIDALHGRDVEPTGEPGAPNL